MKTILSILIFSLSFFSYGQYGADGAVVAGGILTTSALEQGFLDDIESDQDKILISAAITAIEIAALTTVENKLLKSLTSVKSIVNDAQVLLRISRASQDIIQWQDKTYQIAEDHPELIPLIAQHEIKLIREVTYLMKDLLIATTESNTNLLNNKERIDVMKLVLSEIEEVRDKAYEMYTLIQTSTLLGVIETLVIEGVNFNVDYTQIYLEAIEGYNEIFRL